MVQKGSLLQIIDNSGVKKILCIGILKNNKKYGLIGDIIIGAAKIVLSTSNIKRSSIVRALIVRVKKTILRKDGTAISFEDNAAILIDKQNNAIGTRIFGPIAQEIREKNFIKIASLAKEII